MYILFSLLILLPLLLLVLFIYLFAVCDRQVKFRMSTLKKNDGYYVTNEVSRVSFESSFKTFAVVFTEIEFYVLI